MPPGPVAIRAITSRVLFGGFACAELREGAPGLRDRPRHGAGRLLDNRRPGLKPLAASQNEDPLVLEDVALVQEVGVTEETGEQALSLTMSVAIGGMPAGWCLTRLKPETAVHSKTS